MRSPNHPKVTDEIVEGIVGNLRPFKPNVTEKVAANQVRERIAALNRIPNTTSPPSELREVHQRFRKSLIALIEDFERLPLPTRETLMHFAPPFRRWPAGSPQEAEAALLQYLKLLRDVCDGADFVMVDGNWALMRGPNKLKTAVAGHAYALMQEVSELRVSGTDGGPYRMIASLMFEAISGNKEADMKRWCDVEIKRQREHQKILKSFRSA
jgi:hypothetical protein